MNILHVFTATISVYLTLTFTIVYTACECVSVVLAPHKEIVMNVIEAAKVILTVLNLGFFLCLAYFLHGTVAGCKSGKDVDEFKNDISDATTANHWRDIPSADKASIIGFAGMIIVILANEILLWL